MMRFHIKNVRNPTLLRARDRLDVLLNNNALESGIREFVERHKLSGARNECGSSLPAHICQF